MPRSSRQLPPGRSEVTVVGRERFLKGWLAGVSDFLYAASQPPVVLGALAAAALLGYHISLRAEELKELTKLPLLLYRTSYSPTAVYELFDELGPEGRAEYQYVNVLSTGVFPSFVATFLAAGIGGVFHKAKLGHDWNLFPFLFAFAATLENLGVSWLLWRYPEPHINFAALIGILAGLKFRFLWYSVVMLIVGAVWAAKVVLQNKLSRTHQQ